MQWDIRLEGPAWRGCGGVCVCVEGGSWEGWGWELKPYLQSITGAGLDVRAMQQHVERIYDLVFISLFNTILGALRAREWEEEKERKQRERQKGERDGFTSTLVFTKQSSETVEGELVQ